MSCRICRPRWPEGRRARAAAWIGGLALLAAVPQARADWGPGDHELKLDVGGLQRRAVVHVPAAVNPPKALPLVLAFHGGGGHAEFMADDRRYGLSPKADAAGFVVAYPNGYSRFAGGRFATWNAGACCGDARDKGIDDVAFARALVEAIGREVAIDRRRVFAVGMSNGGMMSHRLACDAADLFLAVASVAGTDVTTQCRPSVPVSVLHIHARDDDHVLYAGGAGPGAFRDRSKVSEFTSVPDTMARWAERDRCQPSPRSLPSAPGAACEAYPGCAGGANVQLCSTDEGGHSWPGALRWRRGKEAPSKALDATEVVWGFFETVPAR